MSVARVAERALGLLHRLEDSALALLLAALIVLACVQIVLRNFVDASIPWGEPLLRILVLWTGLIGAVVASRDHRQISIDAVSRLLPAGARVAARALTSAFAAAVSGAIAFHAARFVITESSYESGEIAGVPLWAFQVILPAAFFAIASRYLGALIQDLARLFGDDEIVDEEDETP